MNVIFEKSKLEGSLTAPPSKSYAHRAIICACLSDKKTVIKNIELSKDVSATLSCIVSLGAEVAIGDNEIEITPVKRAKRAVFNCVESGSTLRFMLPVALAIGGEYEFRCDNSLAKRPIKPLVDTLNGKGAEINSLDFPITAKGKIYGGEYYIDTSVSSQFVSGLLLCAPLLGEDLNLHLTGNRVSASYVDITVDVMKKFGVKVEKTSDGYYIKGGQKYVSPEEYHIEGDWSNGAYLLSAGLLCGNVSVKGLLDNSVQGDRACVEIFRKFGGKINIEYGNYVALKSKLTGAEIDLTNNIDLAPCVSAIAFFAKGASKIYGVERLKYKESDRLTLIIDMINRLGGKAFFDGNMLQIEGADNYKIGSVNCGNDHRMVMAASIFGTRIGGVKIDCPKAIEKSYPAFFAHYSRIGGVVRNEE